MAKLPMFLLFTLSYLTIIGIVSAQGLEFNDVFQIFKTGFVDGIAGSWLLAGVIMLGVSLWLGISLGIGIDGLLIFSLPLAMVLITTAFLPPVLNVVFGLIIAIFIYIIYVKLFRR